LAAKPTWEKGNSHKRNNQDSNRQFLAHRCPLDLQVKIMAIKMRESNSRSHIDTYIVMRSSIRPGIQQQTHALSVAHESGKHQCRRPMLRDDET
jgi:hypothetical protein